MKVISGRCFRALYDTSSIRVYHLTTDSIADEALALGTFGQKFNHEKINWLKPSFLWAMHRSNWSTKRGRSRVLAVDIKRSGFDYIFEKATCSVYDKTYCGTEEAWQRKISETNIRCKWDIARDEYGAPTNHLTVQYAISGEISRRYSHEWIICLTDITGMVRELKNLLDLGTPITGLLPAEKTYTESNESASTNHRKRRRET